jgi:hypothetical protein
MTQYKLQKYGLPKFKYKHPQKNVDSSRQGKLGWFGESSRHSLSAKGIKTGSHSRILMSTGIIPVAITQRFIEDLKRQFQSNYIPTDITERRKNETALVVDNDAFREVPHHYSNVSYGKREFQTVGFKDNGTGLYAHTHPRDVNDIPSAHDIVSTVANGRPHAVIGTSFVTVIIPQKKLPEGYGVKDIWKAESKYWGELEKKGFGDSGWKSYYDAIKFINSDANGYYRLIPIERMAILSTGETLHPSRYPRGKW